MMRGRGLLVCVGLIACAESGDRYYRPIDASTYPVANPALGESLAPGEIEEAARIEAIIEAHLHQLYPTGAIYRDAHPKAVGCVSATFDVAPDLPPPFNRGLFAHPHSYPATIRFSNGNEDRGRPDTDPDGRGMAVKVYGVPGPILSPDPQGPPAQDFIMISHPTFIVADPTAYRRTVGYADSSDGLTQLLQPVLAAMSLGVTGTKVALATTGLRIGNPLHTRYWSMVPYALGIGPDAVAVKYSAESCIAAPNEPPETKDPNYLRRAIADSLAAGGRGACMRFMVQPRTSPAMSVEDPRYEWSEQQAPFHHVATLHIPPQAIAPGPDDRSCELLSNSPWHALAEHRPLGAVNRMRKVIYERISALRRQSQQ